MPSQTPNLDLYKVNGETDGNDTFNVDVVLNDNWDKIDAAVGSVETEIESLKQSGVDGKNRLETAIIAKEGTVSKQGQVATFTELDTGIRSIPTGTDTSDATAAAGDILAPKTAYGPNGKITGTIPVLTGNRTATGVAKWPDGALAVYPEKGYQKGGVGDGEIKVTTAQLQGAEAALRSDNIRNGANIFGVPGKSTVVDTADAVLEPQYLLVGQSGYDDGVKKAGTMPNRSAENNHMPGLEKTVWAGDRYFIRPPAGYYNGSTWVTSPEPNLRPENFRAGVNVGGMIGSLKTIGPGSDMRLYHYAGSSGKLATEPKVGMGCSISVAGTYRIQFYLKVDDGYIGYGQIYVNGSPRGTLRTVLSSFYQGFQEDITINGDETIQVYVWTNKSGGYVSIQDFTVSTDIKIITANY